MTRDANGSKALGRFRLIGLIAVVFVIAGVNIASAGESKYGPDATGIELTYDDSQWRASTLASRPFFTCTAEDCEELTCLIVSSANPDLAHWPERLDKAALDAMDATFLEYEKSGGHAEASIVFPTSVVKIAGRDTLVNIITSHIGAFPALSSKYVFRDGGDTHIVTCEGFEEAITAAKDRIETLVGAVRYTAQ